MSHSKTIDDGGPACDIPERFKKTAAWIAAHRLDLRKEAGIQITGLIAEALRDESSRNIAALAAKDAEISTLKAKMEPLVGLLTGLVAESSRYVGYGEEDTFRMGEWFEAHDLAAIEAARAALSSTEGV